MAQTKNVNMTPNDTLPRLRLSQYDVGRELAFKLCDGALSYTVPTGATVKLMGTKPSGFGFTENCTVNGNTASISTTAGMTDEWGAVACELVVEKSGVRLGSTNLLLVVEKSPHPEGTTDGSQETVIPTLTLLVERVEAAASSILDMTVEAETLAAGSDATYSYDEETNTATFGIPRGADGSLASGVLAPTYSTSGTYAVGDYVYYSGNLYRCTTAITTAESWTSGHWTQVALAPEVSDLKADINAFLSTDNLVEFPIDWVQGGYNTSTGATSSLSTRARTMPMPIEWTAVVEESSKVGFVYYASDYSFISGKKFSNKIINALDEAPSNAHYFAITFEHNDGSDVDISSVGCKLYKYDDKRVYSKYVQGQLNGGAEAANSKRVRTDYIKKDDLYIIPESGLRYWIYYYDANKDYTSVYEGEFTSEKKVVFPTGAEYCRLMIAYISNANIVSTIDRTNIVGEGIHIYKKNADIITEQRLKTIETNEPNISFVENLIHEVPQSRGVQATILRARQMTDVKWIAVANMPGLLYTSDGYIYKTFKAGVRQKGIPYSNVLNRNYDTFVGNSISFDAFVTACANENSVLYTNDLWSDVNKSATFYGIVCSKMVQYAWGLPERYHSQYIENLAGLTKIANAGSYTKDDIMLGDGIINPLVHCTIVTDILRNPDTKEVVAIEISEAVSPTCRRLVWAVGDFFSHFANYNLYRYDNIDDAVYVKNPYVDVDDGMTEIVDLPISLRTGTRINIAKNGTLKADVDADKWETIHYVRNGVETTESISSSPITLDTSTTGYVEVYPTDSNGNKGASSHYCVTDANVSYVSDGTNVTITYSSDSTPLYVQWTSKQSQTFTDLSGTGTETIAQESTSFRIAFETDYGIWFTPFYTIS